MNRTMKDVAAMLAARAESVCKLLLSKGKIEGAEWRCADLSGNPGKSLGVRLTGPKAGVWCDFSNGQDCGDLLDLWAAAKSIPLNEAYREAKEWLGIHDAPIITTPKEWKKPNKNGCKQLNPQQKVWEYLTRERRLLNETLKSYKVGEKDGHIVFPYFNPAGELLNIKHLGLERPEGKKDTRLEPGCILPLYGWQAIPKEAREVIITEGEFDAMSWAQLGFPALSVPNGCTSTDWIEHEWENLEPFNTIYLSYDMDEPGRKAVPEIARRLGLHRCGVVSLPHKDMNECLQKGMVAQEAAECLINAKFISPPEICDPAFFRARIEDYFRPAGGHEASFGPTVTQAKLRLRRGELTILSGISGHGKSTLWSQMLVEALVEGRKCAFASLEIPPGVSLGVMNRQFFGREDVPPELVDAFLRQVAGRLWVFNLFGSHPASLIMDLCQYCRARYDVEIFVIDSLMKLDIDGDDYNGQRNFLNKLTKFCMTENCHMILVAHPRKGKNEEEAPGKLDVKGSSDIYNQADNVMLIFRNKEAEKKKDHSGEDLPQAKLVVDKQRMTGVEFSQKLWFLDGPKQFKTNPNSSATSYSSTIPTEEI